MKLITQTLAIISLGIIAPVAAIANCAANPVHGSVTGSGTCTTVGKTATCGTADNSSNPGSCGANAPENQHGSTCSAGPDLQGVYYTTCSIVTDPSGQQSCQWATTPHSVADVNIGGDCKG